MHDSILGFPSTSGIYKITSPTGKVYVGEAVNLRIRCSYYLTPNRVNGLDRDDIAVIAHQPVNSANWIAIGFAVA